MGLLWQARFGYEAICNGVCDTFCTVTAVLDRPQLSEIHFRHPSRMALLFACLRPLNVRCSTYQAFVEVTTPSLFRWPRIFTISWPHISSRSPRWSSRYPRMLLLILLILLVLKFESRRGEIAFICEQKKERINCLERVACVGTIRRESMRQERPEIFSR